MTWVRGLRARVSRPLNKKYKRLRSIKDIEPVVRKLFAEGKTDREIHAALMLPREVSICAMRYYRRELGLVRQSAVVPITEAEAASVSDLEAQGIHAPSEICRRLGMSPSRLRNLCTKFGLEVDGKAELACVPSDEAERWAKALGNKTYENVHLRPCLAFRQRPPLTHVASQSTAAMAAL